jgi:MFS family permease
MSVREDIAVDTGDGGLLSRAFRSLHERNFRLWFVGQTVSQCGTWMQTVAQGWLVMQLSGSALDLGIAVGLPYVPVLLFGAYGGVIADRVDTRRLLIGCQAALLVQSVLLAAIVVAGVAQVWMIWILALLMGVVLAVDTPARLTFVSEMVEPDEVTNAVGLNSMLMTTARIVGPGLAGVLIASIGVAGALLVNPLLKISVIASLLGMRPEELHRQPSVGRQKGQLVSGLRYVWQSPDLRIPLLLLAALGMFTFNWTVLLPLLASGTLHRGGGTYGALMAVMGIGSLLGALLTATRRRPSRRLLVVAAFVVGAANIALAAVSTLPLILLFLVPMGASATLFTSMSVSYLQLESSYAMRGRVMALGAVVFYGATPISGPLTGIIAGHIGVGATLAIGGVAALIAAACAAIALRRVNLSSGDKDDVGEKHARSPADLRGEPAAIDPLC